MNLKKTLLLSASLLLLGNVSGLSANASHVHHHIHHVKTVRMVQRHILTYHQLRKAMDYDYYNTSEKYTKAINTTIKHNMKYYSNHQLYSILNDIDTDLDASPDFDSNILTTMQNNYYNRKSVLKQSSNQHSAFNNQLRVALIKDINQSRIENGKKPLKIGGYAQHVADYRNSHVQRAYDKLGYRGVPEYNTHNPMDVLGHGLKDGTSNVDYMNNNYYNFNNSGENASNWSPTFSNKFYGNALKYQYDTPAHIAYNVNEIMTDYDNYQGNNNGHRDNELSSDYHYLGVGVSYNSKTQIGTVNEQFL